LWAAYERSRGRRERSLATKALLPAFKEAIDLQKKTVFRWRDAFLAKRRASLSRGPSSGRPPKRTPRQLKRFKEPVMAGPEAAGYATGCWNAAQV
jgi:transposase